MSKNPQDCSSSPFGGVLPGLPTAEEIAKLPADGGPDFNRLIFETSPYLLQHARNPVDWYSWGEEAFAKAAAEDKPIFLSLGYSTCHWCHVMEEESFVDAGVGRILNEGFVSIKVDREQRPDVDHLYMITTQSLTGSGGWPNTLLLTPDRKPFFAGTYIPRVHLLELLEQAQTVWASERENVNASADRIAQDLTAHLGKSAAGTIDPALTGQTAVRLVARYDREYGGFGNAPKFPTPQNLTFLIRAGTKLGKDAYRRVALDTLRAMRRGGIYDQLGFGFHRYSTDRTWTIPHFEKMLYDQALAVMAYIEAFGATRDPFFRVAAEEVLTYVDRDLGDPEGGFYSAEDADSEGEEGKFYLWSEAELDSALGPDSASVANFLFETTSNGNYAEEASGRRTGANVLRLDPKNPLDSPDLEDIRRQLLAERNSRIRPLKDDTILCDWNGLMIVAFARAGAVLDEPKWTMRAGEAADFILRHLRLEDGALRHSYRLRRGQGNPGSQDYAFLLWGIVELVQATGNPVYLKRAREVADRLLSDFWDAEGGGFFMSGAGANDLFARAKEANEGAIPSSNGVAAYALSVLSRLTAERRYHDFSVQTVEAFGADIGRSPDGFVTLMLASEVQKGSDAVVVGDPDAESFRGALSQLRSVYSPGAIILPLDSKRSAEYAEASPFLGSLRVVEGKSTVYICRDFACGLPTTDIGAAMKMLVT